jgi:hypothetical protein
MPNWAKCPPATAISWGRLDLSHGLTTTSFVPDHSGWFHRLFGPLTAMKYNAAGFAVIFTR